MTPAEAKRYLNSFINYELKPETAYAPSLQLERVVRLLGAIGNPQNNFKIIHVAGTKGKGSTCAFAAHILREAGYTVGLYTSPHLYNGKERIRILSLSLKRNSHDVFEGKISEKDFCRTLETIKPDIETARQDKQSGSVTFFEVYTALALKYFSDRKIDCAVLETGLGGRLDATNAADSAVCGITPISIEHTVQLGKTLKDIAAEKSAIIKNKNQTIIIAPQDTEAMTVIEDKCRAVGARFLTVGREIVFKPISGDIDGQTFEVKTPQYHYRKLRTRLLGRHQALNCAAAIGLVESLKSSGINVSARAVEEGIKNTQWPGRFEIVRRDPFVVLDGAHNPGSCRILADSVRDIFPEKKVTLILGVSSDKDKAGICRELSPVSQKIILTKSDHPRAFEFTPESIDGSLDMTKVVFTKNLKDALDCARKEAAKDGVILVTGSLFTVAEARKLCGLHN